MDFKRPGRSDVASGKTACPATGLSIVTGSGIIPTIDAHRKYGAEETNKLARGEQDQRYHQN
jgi:hypothetical protein